MNRGEDGIVWRAKAMRMRRSAPNAPLRAREGPFPFRACQRCGLEGAMFATTCAACGGKVKPLCYSCGEPTEHAGGRCNLCFAAALGVVPTSASLPPRERAARPAKSLRRDVSDTPREVRQVGLFSPSRARPPRT